MSSWVVSGSDVGSDQEATNNKWDDSDSPCEASRNNWNDSDSGSELHDRPTATTTEAPPMLQGWADSDSSHDDVVDVTNSPTVSAIAGNSSGLRQDRSRSPMKRSISKVRPQVRANSSSSLPTTHFHLKNARSKPNFKKRRALDSGSKWWLAFLVQFVESIIPKAIPARPMTHVSLFSGLLSEIAHADDLGIWQHTHSACDTKESAQTFAKLNFIGVVDHYFKSIKESTAGVGLCAFHPGCYCRSQPMVIDCLSSGSPCTAWASTRDKTKQGPRTGPITTHPDWVRTFVDFFAFLDKHQVSGGYCEQVKGFSQKCRELPRGFKSPKDMFLNMLAERGYSCQVITKNDHRVWCELPRDRLRLPNSCNVFVSVRC